MGFLEAIFGYSKDASNFDEPYAAPYAFQENLAKQTEMSPQVVARLRQLGMAEDASLRLEYFFYTDTQAGAREFAEVLTGLEYEVKFGRSAGNSRLYVVTGWTIPIRMTDQTVIAWTRRMCRLGYEYGCEFDGWGANPTQ